MMTNNKELVNRTRDHNWWVFGHWRLVGFDSSKKMYEGGSLSALDIKQEWWLNWQDLWTRIFVIVLSNILIIIEIGLEYVSKVEIGVLPKLRDNSCILWIQYFQWKIEEIMLLGIKMPVMFFFDYLFYSFDLKCWMIMTLSLRKFVIPKRTTLKSDQSVGFPWNHIWKWEEVHFAT